GGAIVIGPVTLNAATASASLSGLAAGPHTIVASYGGDVSNQPSVSTTFTQVVNTGAGKVPTTTTLTSSTSVSIVGQPVTFTVTVSGSAPTGTVTLSDQNSTLATVPLVNGVASFTTSSLAKGAHQITATYSGDGANLPSSSSKLKQQVQ
ncbi:MAG TPA: Ig-like domain-containing protein, partial [Chloroflexota bacterium]|nr:Ig-like domain-containing protein [Chloroflexota bacterium]